MSKGSRTRMCASVLATLGGLAVASSAARAGTITETIDFGANGFAYPSGSLPPPLSALSGRFTITFDPTLGYDDTPTGVTLDSISSPAVVGADGVEFQYSPVFGLVVGGAFDGAGVLGIGVADFAVILGVNGSTVTFQDLWYSEVGLLDFARSGTGTASVEPLLAAVPLPPAALGSAALLAGVGIPAAVRRRRKTLAI